MSSDPLPSDNSCAGNGSGTGSGVISDAGISRGSAAPARDWAVRCADVTKTYVVYNRLFRGLFHSVTRPHVANPHVRLVHALTGIDLEIRKGEVFGFLGPNGAGKSTLLACIAGITPINDGRIDIDGPIEALLRIGVGFHPRFTGRENILIGLIAMGAAVDEAKAAVDKVLDFAELTDFGDMPFYTYSSGMMARLQFSVAVHRTPEILLLDEALAAGDGFFNAKATRRIEDICAGGSTVLVVSHSVSAIEALCQRAVILDKGKIVATGTARDVGAEYRGMVSSASAKAYQAQQQAVSSRIGGAVDDDSGGAYDAVPDDGQDDGQDHGQHNAREKAAEKATIPRDVGTGEIRLLGGIAEFGDGAKVGGWNRPMSLLVDILCAEAIEDPRFRVDIYTAHLGVLATSFGNYSVDPLNRKPRNVSLGLLQGRRRLRFEIPALPLGGQTYFWSFALMPKNARRKLESEADYYVFRRVVGYFQVESFPDQPGMIGRTTMTEIPVDISIEGCDAAGASPVELAS